MRSPGSARAMRFARGGRAKSMASPGPPATRTPPGSSPPPPSSRSKITADRRQGDQPPSPRHAFAIANRRPAPRSEGGPAMRLRPGSTSPGGEQTGIRGPGVEPSPPSGEPGLRANRSAWLLASGRRPRRVSLSWRGERPAAARTGAARFAVPDRSTSPRRAWSRPRPGLRSDPNRAPQHAASTLRGGNRQPIGPQNLGESSSSRARALKRRQAARLQSSSPSRARPAAPMPVSRRTPRRPGPCAGPTWKRRAFARASRTPETSAAAPADERARAVAASMPRRRRLTAPPAPPPAAP